VNSAGLSLQIGGDETCRSTRILIVGEVLWDIFTDSMRLGGAPLNFAVHGQRLGHAPLLISALGEDNLGKQALHAIKTLGIDTTALQTTNQFPTGTARVHLGMADQNNFFVHRPAAFDAVKVSEEQIQRIQDWSPQWFYFGTLFPTNREGHVTLLQLLRAVPGATRFYDLNLRPGSDSPMLVCELLEIAHVVKLNSDEMRAVSQFSGLPSEPEAFCRDGSQRFQWRAVCITLGAHGCAMLTGGEYVEAPSFLVDVADTVGAGDAFAAAFLHGLTQKWDTSKIAAFSNRVGALVASRPGAIPEWTLAEAAELRGRS
jgi:fructokinase